MVGSVVTYPQIIRSRCLRRSHQQRHRRQRCHGSSRQAAAQAEGAAGGLCLARIVCKRGSRRWNACAEGSAAGWQPRFARSAPPRLLATAEPIALTALALTALHGAGAQRRLLAAIVESRHLGGRGRRRLLRRQQLRRRCGGGGRLNGASAIGHSLPRHQRRGGGGGGGGRRDGAGAGRWLRLGLRLGGGAGAGACNGRCLGGGAGARERLGHRHGRRGGGGGGLGGSRRRGGQAARRKAAGREAERKANSEGSIAGKPAARCKPRATSSLGHPGRPGCQARPQAHPASSVLICAAVVVGLSFMASRRQAAGSPVLEAYCSARERARMVSSDEGAGPGRRPPAHFDRLSPAPPPPPPPPHL